MGISRSSASRKLVSTVPSGFMITQKYPNWPVLVACAPLKLEGNGTNELNSQVLGHRNRNARAQPLGCVQGRRQPGGQEVTAGAEAGAKAGVQEGVEAGMEGGAKEGAKEGGTEAGKAAASEVVN